MYVPEDCTSLVGLGQLIKACPGAGVCQATDMNPWQAAFGWCGIPNTLQCSSPSSQVELLSSQEHSTC